MVIHDEDTLQQALILAEQTPVRYSDQYSYIVYSKPFQLEYALRRALERGDIAIVVPVGQERAMEEYSRELRRVKEQRRREELRGVKKWISEHPELKEATTEEEIVRLFRKSKRVS